MTPIAKQEHADADCYHREASREVWWRVSEELYANQQYQQPAEVAAERLAEECPCQTRVSIYHSPSSILSVARLNEITFVTR